MTKRQQISHSSFVQKYQDTRAEANDLSAALQKLLHAVTSGNDIAKEVAHCEAIDTLAKYDKEAAAQFQQEA